MLRNPNLVYTKQQQMAELAKRTPKIEFTSLNHHIDLAWLEEAHRRTRKGGAVGVDGRTAADYEAQLETNLAALRERAKSGLYKAPPVRRVYIPKGSGRETRPIGIPTFEDKVLQRAVVMVLEPIYEQDFYDCSYGFRPRRSAHQALQMLWRQVMRMGGGWILEVDISKFFDTLVHARLRELLQRRVRDGVLRRLIDKWLKAGVLEEGQWRRTSAGSPQGGVISPLLANVYLHYVLDEWFEQEVKPRLKGEAFLIRYADDFVIGFKREDDAHRVQAVLPKRFDRFGLSLHPDKTRLVPFRRPLGSPRGGKAAGAGTFDLLGFTHYWAASRQGRWVVKRKTAASRVRRASRTIARWCRANRHRPVAVQHAELSRKLRGHYQYYGITGNYRSIARFMYEVRRTWYKWLGRRNSEHYPWSRYERLLARYPLPLPRVVHSVYSRSESVA